MYVYMCMYIYIYVCMYSMYVCMYACMYVCMFPSHYLPLPTLDVPSPVVNPSSHLITCHFQPWTSHLLSWIRLPISLPATSHLGRPISCGKFVFPSHYLPLPILDVCVSLEVPRFLSNLIKYSHVICQKMGKYLPVRSAHNSHVMCIIKNT